MLLLVRYLACRGEPEINNRDIRILVKTASKLSRENRDCRQIGKVLADELFRHS